mmetsp:Transcript_38635/g.111521  ORF Transcript_38635/g.111521 Transcript_38635/m.111521 type:complete len:201 (-) Transcript_38635:369-971(-)
MCVATSDPRRCGRWQAPRPCVGSFEACGLWLRFRDGRACRVHSRGTWASASPASTEMRSATIVECVSTCQPRWSRSPAATAVCARIATASLCSVGRRTVEADRARSAGGRFARPCRSFSRKTAPRCSMGIRSTSIDTFTFRQVSTTVVGKTYTRSQCSRDRRRPTRSAMLLARRHVACNAERRPFLRAVISVAARCAPGY